MLCTAVLLLVWAGPAVAQEQPPPKSEPQPQAASPNQPAAEKPAPQSTEPQATAPNPSKPEEPAPKEQAAPRPQDQPQGNAQTPAATQPPGAAPQSKPQPKRSVASRKKKVTKASAAQTHRPTQPQKPGTAQPDKVVVRNGGARDDSVQLSPALSQEQDSRNRQNTDQLLATTDENLKRVAGRQLTPSQQSTVDQIRAYMRQARSAADAGDLARAHILAFKAHLLSDDLAKP
jgi:hypothetical protein